MFTMPVSRRMFMATAATAIIAPGARSAGRRSLFNGRDLQGWRQAAYGRWSVEDRAIVCRYHPTLLGPGYLFTEDEFRDFTLELEFWVSRGGNSGIFVRQPWREFGPKGTARPAHSPGDGVEVQIDYNDPKNLTGSVYDLRKCTKLLGEEERWVPYKITCTGTRIQVYVDNQQVNDYDGLPSLKGAIGLQMHGAQRHQHVVRFRNIQITEL